jgi:CheY-like chemotaxis protein
MSYGGVMDVARTQIMVVDDYVDAADSTVELLSLWGYDAIAYYTGAAALESAGISRPDVVVLELAMPRMNGFQFTGLFRELSECGSIPIIAVSAYYSQAYSTKASEVGIQHYLLKPADPEYLKNLLALTIAAEAVHSPSNNNTANRFAPKIRRTKKRILHGMFNQEYTTPRVRIWSGS